MSVTLDPRSEPLPHVYGIVIGLARLFDQARQTGQLSAEDLSCARLAIEGAMWALESVPGVADRAIDADLPFATWRAAERLQIEARNMKGPL